MTYYCLSSESGYGVVLVNLPTDGSTTGDNRWSGPHKKGRTSAYLSQEWFEVTWTWHHSASKPAVMCLTRQAQIQASEYPW